MELKFDAKGLIPAIVQDHYTKEVLTLAYMNAETPGPDHCRGAHRVLVPQPPGDLAQGRYLRQCAARGIHHRRLRQRRTGGGGGQRTAPPATPARRAASSTRCMSRPELKQFSWQGLYGLIEGRKTDPEGGQLHHLPV